MNAVCKVVYTDRLGRDHVVIVEEDEALASGAFKPSLLVYEACDWMCRHVDELDQRPDYFFGS